MRRHVRLIVGSRSFTLRAGIGEKRVIIWRYLQLESVFNADDIIFLLFTIFLYSHLCAFVKYAIIAMISSAVGIR